MARIPKRPQMRYGGHSIPLYCVGHSLIGMAHGHAVFVVGSNHKGGFTISTEVHNEGGQVIAKHEFNIEPGDLIDYVESRQF